MTTVFLTFDFDAFSVWITSLQETSPTPLSRGEYGARVGLPRILELLRTHNIQTTFFVPGHSALTFPDIVKEIINQGHEIAAHSFLHQFPTDMTLDEERDDMIKTEKAIYQVTGVKPVGYRSPAWDLSPNTLSLLVERGYLYDSSLMADDFTVYAPRSGDTIAEDGHVTWGNTLPLVEYPVAWELDDFVYFQHLKRPRLQGLLAAEKVGEIWLKEFDYCARHVENGVFTIAMHPQVIGRGPRILMLDNLITKMKKFENVKFSRMDEYALQIGETLTPKDGR